MCQESRVKIGPLPHLTCGAEPRYGLAVHVKPLYLQGFVPYLILHHLLPLSFANQLALPSFLPTIQPSYRYARPWVPRIQPAQAYGVSAVQLPNFSGECLGCHFDSFGGESSLELAGVGAILLGMHAFTAARTQPEAGTLCRASPSFLVLNA